MADKKPPQSAEELLQRYEDGERDFRGANLEGAYLSDANLRSANLQEAQLSRAHLTRANLERAKVMDAILFDADLSGTNLVGADLERAVLGRVNFNGACYDSNTKFPKYLDYKNMGMIGPGTNIEEAVIRNAFLKGADLEGANFKKTKFEKADLEGANLQKADLSYADLKGGNLEGTKLEGADLERANLQAATLDDANLRGANFRGANLRGANLQRADLEGADLERADLRDTELLESNLDLVSLTGAAFDDKTDLLTANWKTLIIGEKTYHREAVERGQEILPFGMGNPLKFVFGIDREINGDDVKAIRTVLRGLEHTKATSVSFRVTGDKEELLLEGRGPATEAGNAASMLVLLPHIYDELKELKASFQEHREENQEAHGQLSTTVQEHREENQEAHGQQLLIAAKEASNDKGLLELVKVLYLKEIELRNEKEIEQFKNLIDDMKLQEYLGVSGTTIKILKTSAAMLPIIELILSAFGFGAVAAALKTIVAGSGAVKALITAE